MFNKKREYVSKIVKHYEMAEELLFEAQIITTIHDNDEVYDYHVNKALKIYQTYIEQI